MFASIKFAAIPSFEEHVAINPDCGCTMSVLQHLLLYNSFYSDLVFVDFLVQKVTKKWKKLNFFFYFIPLHCLFFGVVLCGQFLCGVVEFVQIQTSIN